MCVGGELSHHKFPIAHVKDYTHFKNCQDFFDQDFIFETHFWRLPFIRVIIFQLHFVRRKTAETQESQYERNFENKKFAFIKYLLKII